jgi:hypothetical protein
MFSNCNILGLQMNEVKIWNTLAEVAEILNSIPNSNNRWTDEFLLSEAFHNANGLDICLMWTPTKDLSPGMFGKSAFDVLLKKLGADEPEPMLYRLDCKEYEQDLKTLAYPLTPNQISDLFCSGQTLIDAIKRFSDEPEINDDDECANPDQPLSFERYVDLRMTLASPHKNFMREDPIVVTRSMVSMTFDAAQSLIAAIQDKQKAVSTITSAPDDTRLQVNKRREMVVKNRKNEILEILSELGYDPLKLSANVPGKNAARFYTGERFKEKNRSLWYSTNAYHKTWQELLTEQRIIYENTKK